MQLLELAAFLAPEPIPLALIGDHPELLDEPLRSTATDPDTLADTVGALIGYSLARRHPDAFQVHRLVQAVIRHQLGSDRSRPPRRRWWRYSPLRPAATRRIRSSWGAYARLAPQLLATAPLDDHSPANRQLLDTIRYLQAKGDHHATRAVAEPLLDRWRASLGPDHPDTLTAASRLTLALNYLGET